MSERIVSSSPEFSDAPAHLRSCGLQGGAADGEMRHFTPCAWQVVQRPLESRSECHTSVPVVWSNPGESPVVVTRPINSPSSGRPQMQLECSGKLACHGTVISVEAADLMTVNCPGLSLALHGVCTNNERYFVDESEVVVINYQPLTQK